MSPDTINIIVRLLEQDLGAAGDNLLLARSAARGRDASLPWVGSGQTLQQIIDGYQAWHDKTARAIAEFEKIAGRTA
jgi:hypothetical protein